jgi:hypothetical protein
MEGLMSNAQEHQDSKAPGHYANQGPQEGPATGQDAGPGREEHYQRMKEQAPGDQNRQRELASGERSDAREADRNERIRQRAYRLWEEAGRPAGQAEDHWQRAAADLDREDAELQRAGMPATRRIDRE